MPRTWANGTSPYLSADNLNAMEADITSALGVPDAALAARVNDGASATRAALNATFVPKWKATTAYLAGDAVLSPAGDTVTAIANFTSGASYNAANWNLSPSYPVKADVIPKWKATTAYLAGDKVLNPSGEVVSAIANFTSGASYNASNWNPATRIWDQSEVMGRHVGLKTYGTVIPLGSGGQFDAGMVDSPCVFFDPVSGRLAMTYTGATTTTGTAVESGGLAFSDDGITWTKQGQFFAPSGTTGAKDEKGTTGHVIVVDESNTYHLFYIGLTALGIEAGEKNIMHATATNLMGPWTRQGVIISPSGATGSWRKTYVWHPNIVYRKGTWYMFFNATGENGSYFGIERAGYATATSLNGPWTVQDADCPLLSETGHETDKGWGVDPFVSREGDHWRMDFGRADSAFTAIGDYWATTTDALFPKGWVVQGQTTSYATAAVYKPWIMKWNGQIYHYGSYYPSAITLAITPDVTNEARTVDARWRFNATQTTGQDSTVMVGDDIRSATATGHAKLQIGKSNGISELLLGQDNNHSVILNWIYNATASAATASLETYGGSNQLNIQNNNGNVMLVGAGGKLGFHGTAPIARQTATPAAATDLATALTLVNDLRAKLLALGIIA